MNVPETYSELQDAVAELDARCPLRDNAELALFADLSEILDAADKLARNCDDDTVDAALQACRDCIGSHASKDEYIHLLSDNWSVYEDVEEYAQSMAEAMCVEIPDFIKYHVDWDSLGHELLQDCSVSTIYEGRLYIFQE